MSIARAIRILVWIALVIALIVFLVLIAVRPATHLMRIEQHAGTTDLPSDVSFDLLDHYGRRVTNADYEDRALAVFFGFTRCPDVCPTALIEMSAMLSETGAGPDRIQVLFITIDPERDTLEVLKDYVAAIDTRFVGLTGSTDQIKRVTSGYKVYFKKIVQAGATSYSMDHTATVFLLDRQHRFTGTLDLHEDRKASIAKLMRLARS